MGDAVGDVAGEMVRGVAGAGGAAVEAGGEAEGAAGAAEVAVEMGTALINAASARRAVWSSS